MKGRPPAVIDRVPDLAAMRQRFVEEGIWARPFEDVVYLMPPLVIGPEDLDTLIDAVVRVVADWSKSPP